MKRRKERKQLDRMFNVKVKTKIKSNKKNRQLSGPNIGRKNKKKFIYFVGRLMLLFLLFFFRGILTSLSLSIDHDHHDHHHIIIIQCFKWNFFVVVFLVMVAKIVVNKTLCMNIQNVIRDKAKQQNKSNDNDDVTTMMIIT